MYYVFMKDIGLEFHVFVMNFSDFCIIKYIGKYSLLFYFLKNLCRLDIILSLNVSRIHQWRHTALKFVCSSFVSCVSLFGGKILNYAISLINTGYTTCYLFWKIGISNKSKVSGKVNNIFLNNHPWIREDMKKGKSEVFQTEHENENTSQFVKYS